MRAISLNALALSCFLHPAPFVAGHYVCNPAYGRPTYSDCLDLTYSLFNGWPGTLGDKYFHLYSLRMAPIPDWIEAGASHSRVWIPKFARQANCVMSLTPILLSNGSVTVDTAYWQDIWLGSHRTVTQCVPGPLHLGGHVHVGLRGMLILTLYEPKSQHVSDTSQSLLPNEGTMLSYKAYFWTDDSSALSRYTNIMFQNAIADLQVSQDMEVQRILRKGNFVCSKQDASTALFADDPEAIPCERMTDTERDYGILEILSGAKSSNATNHTGAVASRISVY